MDWHQFAELYIPLIVTGLLLLIGLTRLRYQATSSANSWGWALAMIFMPWLAVPIYLLLGSRKVSARQRRKRPLQFVSHRDNCQSCTRLDRLIQAYHLPAASSGNAIQFYSSEHGGLQALVELLESATREIDVSVYILRADRTGRRVVELLAQKARAGVKVRVLVDGVGSWLLSNRALRQLRQHGGELAVFHPLLKSLLTGRGGLRNHRKLVVIDQHAAWTGGANLAQEYFAKLRKQKPWRDLVAVVRGPAVHELVSIFRSDWQYATGQQTAVAPLETGVGGTGTAILQVLPSGPDVEGEPLLDAVLTAIYNAERQITILSPYFVPDDSVQFALESALRRGVQVTIILPRKSDNLLVDAARKLALAPLLRHGLNLRAIHGRMMHAKAIIVDDMLAIIGSANFDYRSFFLNYELSLVLHDRDSVTALQQWIDNTCGQAQNWPALKPLGPLSASLLHLIKPLL
ncbi:MAG: phospholipase D-like domain-containing protein [Pseudomonadota bacterium]